MNKVYKLSDVDIEEFDNASLEIDGIKYQLSKVTKSPDEFEERGHHCDICALYDKCCSVIPNLDVCGAFCEMLDLNLQEKDKLFFN